MTSLDYWSQDFQLSGEPRKQTLNEWNSSEYKKGVKVGEQALELFNRLKDENNASRFFKELRQGYNDYVQTHGDHPSKEFPAYYFGADLALHGNTFAPESKERQHFYNGFYDKAIIDPSLSEF